MFVQPNASVKGRADVPDALLFADEAAHDRARKERSDWKRSQHGLCVVEAKRWNRVLDREKKGKNAEAGVPSTQMLRYLRRVELIPVLLVSPLHLARAEKNSVVQIYTAPEVNLAEIDRSILDQLGQGARRNFADQALNDRSVIESLSSAAERGAHIRLYLDPREVERLALDNEHPLVKLSRTRNVEIKLKASADGSMRLKGYSVNGSLLRTGSAIFRALSRVEFWFPVMGIG